MTAVPTRKDNFMNAYGPTTLDVRAYGAVGDGIIDDTTAFQRAIDSLPDGGGTVVVPAGDYRIDGTRRVKARSRLRLLGQGDPVLRMLPNDLPRAYVLEIAEVEDVLVLGLAIEGDRMQHTYTAQRIASQNTHEWGHGISIGGNAKRITLSNLHVSRCTGDGICLGGNASDVLITDVTSVENRRQALSITRAQNVRVRNSTFSRTGAFNDNPGTKPMAGIDLEPDSPGVQRNILIEDCVLEDNEGAGILATTSASALEPATINAVQVLRNTIQRNGSGLYLARLGEFEVISNVVRDNRATGLRITGGAHQGWVSENTFSGNYAQNKPASRAPRVLYGLADPADATLTREILITDGLVDVRGGRQWIE
jgi:polygalacturonase